MSHRSFSQRPHYRQQFNCQQLRENTAAHSRAGHYNLTTLWWYRKLWLSSGKGYDYLAYLSFRRALGYPLSANKAARLQQMLQPWPRRLWHKLYGHRLRQCHNLLAEYHCLQGRPLAQAAVPRRYQQQVRYWRSQQPLWHSQLSQMLQQASSVQLVGNSPALAGSNQGAAIDAADIVIRFNQYQSVHTDAGDSGSKCSLWVMAPAFAGTVPDNLNWCLVSGPDMLWWQQRWPQLAKQTNLKLLSIPLAHWRALVRQLAAPPSAGLLVNHFITSLIAKPATLQLAGFGYNAATAQYHYAAPGHTAVARHNWPAEYLLLQQCQPSTEKSTEHKLNS